MVYIYIYGVLELYTIFNIRRRGMFNPRLIILFAALLSELCMGKVRIPRPKSVKSKDRYVEFCSFCETMQRKIIAELEYEERIISSSSCPPAKFNLDPWERRTSTLLSSTGGLPLIEGEGVTAVLQGGQILEKAAVSTTFASGKLTAQRAEAISARRAKTAPLLVGTTYYAAALSLVLHSRSPMVPTFRADIRYFELEDGTGWFGGGADLTPYYLFDEDAKSFHSHWKVLCDKHAGGAGGTELFRHMKEECDKYFFIPSRGEHRGIGGIFFDDLDCLLSTSGESGLDAAMAFTFDVCTAFMPSFLPIARERNAIPYTPMQRHWQLLRRGRYIEFNMLYDRGVRFGLVPGGRIEAVMVSCPPLVAWDYNHVPAPGSEEERLMCILKKPRDWV